MTKTFILTLAAALFMSGCGGGYSDCNDQIDDYVKAHGNPEEVNRFDDGDYHSWDYWYWSQGFERTFTWGGPVDGCETSDYTFAPIY